MVLISCFKNNKLLAYCLTVFFMHSSNRLLNILRILFVQISDLEADYEESQRNIQQLKKKAQRLTAELQDTKLHLEGQQSRNHDLEKKQRKSVHKHTQSSFTCHVITQFYYFTCLWLVPGRPISNGVITTVIVNKLQCFMCVCVCVFLKGLTVSWVQPRMRCRGREAWGRNWLERKTCWPERSSASGSSWRSVSLWATLWHVALVKGFFFSWDLVRYLWII